MSSLKVLKVKHPLMVDIPAGDPAGMKSVKKSIKNSDLDYFPLKT